MNQIDEPGALQPIITQPLEQNQFAQPPVSPESLQPPQSPQQPSQQFKNDQDYIDIYGIISLTAIITGFQLIGAVLGYLGMKKAIKEGHNPILSKIGFWANLVITILATIWLGFVIFSLVTIDN